MGQHIALSIKPFCIIGMFRDNHMKWQAKVKTRANMGGVDSDLKADAK
jgi:hypothetical protein